MSKKFPCDKGRLQCPTCRYKCNDHSNMSKHKKRCRGRVIPRYILEQNQDTRIAQLNLEIEELKKRLNPQDRESDTIAEAAEDICDLRLSSSLPTNIKRATWVNDHLEDLMTIGETDVKHKQVYFFVCGPNLFPFEDQKGIPIKIGSTDDTYTRISTHIRDFGGGYLIDSVLTNNPKTVEHDLKQWLKATGRFVKCQAQSKSSIEKEVFAARSQADYRFIVTKAVEFMEDYKRDVETLSVCQDQLATALEENRALKESAQS